MITNSPKSDCRREQGFTLVEMVIAAVGILLVLLVVMRLTGSVLSTTAQFNEVHERSGRASVLEENLVNDFGRAGNNFFIGYEPLAGNFFPKFQPNADYEVNSEQFITKIRPGASVLLTEPILREGGGSMMMTGGTGKFFMKSLVDLTDSNLGVLQITYNSWTIYKNSPYRVVAADQTNPKKGRLYDDQFEIVSEIAAATQACSINYYRVRAGARTLLYHDPTPCPTYPLQPAINLDAYSNISRFRLSGLFVLNSAEGTLAKLPFTTATAYRLSRPIEKLDDGSTLFLSGDKDIDRTYLKSEVKISPLGDSTPLSVNKPQRGAFVPGDYVYLADFSGFGGVLLRVTASTVNTADDSLGLAVEPVDAVSKAAWNLYYSSPNDYFNVAFPAGSHLFRVAPPVRWRADAHSESSAGSISRREGSDDWNLVAVGADDFTIDFSNSCLCYRVAAKIQADNAEVASRPDLPLSLDFKPPFIF